MAREFKMYINGEWVSALDGQLYDDLNPYTSEVFARVPAGFGGRAGLEELTELRWISMQLTPREYPFQGTCGHDCKGRQPVPRGSALAFG